MILVMKNDPFSDSYSLKLQLSSGRSVVRNTVFGTSFSPMLGRRWFVYRAVHDESFISDCGGEDAMAWLEQRVGCSLLDHVHRIRIHTPESV